MERISASTIRRLSGYVRVLDDLVQQGESIASSKELAERTGVTSAQVRKDLSHFGSFGRRGYGYEVDSLRTAIRGILGLSRRWRVAIVGAGNVGTALSTYKEFRARGFDVVAVFDIAPERIGQRLGDDLVIEPMDRFAEIARERAVEIGVIATPARAAQEAADVVVAGGVKALLNFAPRKLTVPRGVTLRDVNLAVELESLAFALRAGTR
ncbi:MAG TPA: redox-sensing transcriptional repressor Rex [Candidatus Eisenbacteria bacterium]|nr:redox-sensing transcriptional repressor Rex [Candidatus Eisenbacteria bacterium]